MSAEPATVEPADEVVALLRKVKRLGVHHVDYVTGAGGVVLQAKVQAGRSHRQLRTSGHADQLGALRELVQLAEAKR